MAEVPLPRLRRLQIELVNVCNYRCPLCRTPKKDGVARTRMPPERLRELLAPVGADLLEVALFGTRGEPYLHPELERCIALVKQLAPAAACEVSTNGSLVDAERARATLAAGLDRLVFAVDGLTQESYARYRVGGALARVLENLRLLCELKARGGYGTRVVLQVIPMSSNEHELQRLPEWGYGLGVDEVRLKVSASVSRSAAFRPRDARYRLLDPAAEPPSFECPFGLDKLYVDPSGDCFPCCYAEGRAGQGVGNAFAEGLPALWRGLALRRFRAPFLGEGAPDPYCRATCGRRALKHKLKLARPDEVDALPRGAP